MRVIIAGSRGVAPRVGSPLLIQAVADWQREHGSITEVVSGAEPTGIDRVGEAWAQEAGVPCRRFPFLGGRGRAGGPIRNSEMAAYASGLILICALDAHDQPATPGSADMLRKARGQARKRAFPVLVVPLGAGS